MGRHAVYLGIWDPQGGVVREEVSRTTLPVRDRAVRSGFWRLSLEAMKIQTVRARKSRLSRPSCSSRGSPSYPLARHFSTDILYTHHPIEEYERVPLEQEITCISSITCGFSRTGPERPVYLH